MNDEKVTRVRKVIRAAFSRYPKSDSTIDLMIEQAIRSGYIRGRKEAETEPGWINDFGF